MNRHSRSWMAWIGTFSIFVLALSVIRSGSAPQAYTSRERVRPSNVPLSPLATPRWDYIADHSTVVIEVESENFQGTESSNVSPMKVFGDGFVIWLEREGEPPAARLYQGWLSGDQMQALFDYIALQGFWEMEEYHTREIPCGEEGCRNMFFPFHSIQVRLSGRERKIVESTPSYDADRYGLEGTQPGFAVLFEYLVHGAGAVHKEDYYPVLGCLNVSPIDDPYATTSTDNPHKYPKWPFEYQVSLGYVPIGAREQARISGSGLYMVRVTGDVLDFAWQHAFDLDGDDRKTYREGERAYAVWLEVPEIATLHTTYCPDRAQEPSSHPPFPTALPRAPIPSPTPIPSGQWTLYDPLGNSGWSSLFPSHLNGLQTIAFADSEHAMTAGSPYIMRYYPDRSPTWWQLEYSTRQIMSWVPRNVWAIAPTGPDSGWMAGTNSSDEGWLAQYESDHWQRILGPTTERLWDIQMLTPQEGWAVGENGTLLHYTEREWKAIRAPVTNTLYSLSMVAPNRGWAVGRDGTILNYDGYRWKQSSSPTREHLRGVSMIQAQDGAVEGWAVGAHGVLAHYRSNHSPEWELVTGPVENNLHAVATQAPNNVWAVGAYGSLLHYDGISWETDPAMFGGPEYAPRDTLWDVVMLSHDEGWAAGGESVLHYHDGIWESESEPYPHARGLHAIDFAAPDDGWIIRNDGGFLHYDGAQWRIASSIPQHHDFRLEMISHDAGWAIGDHLYRFNGQEWSRVFLPEDAHINALQMFDPDGAEGWAVGDTGKIVHYINGRWMPVESPTIADLYDLSMLSPDDGWARGRLRQSEEDSPVLLRYTSGSWEMGPTWPISESYVIDFEMVSPDEGWFIYGIENSLFSSYILHYKEGNWQEIELPAVKYADHGYELEAIDMTSADEGWIVGEVILHYDGVQWKAVTSLLGNWHLYDVDMLSPNEGWAVGGSGTIMRFSAPP